MHWMFLAIAIVFEVAGTTSMKLSGGLTRLTPSLLIFVFYGIAFVFNTLALRKLDISVTYAIWSGVGTALTALIGIIWFREPAGGLKLASIGLIVLGILGLRLSWDAA
ncbi:MAG: multidrug efflux SMR transporter [Burkholderiaceae bacterium]|nr:multidrug efflux SMR transporter [Burkholderiaceae bacterium]